MGRRGILVLLGIVLLTSPVWMSLLRPFLHASLQATGRAVASDDSIQPADFIFVLNGRVMVRAHHAAELYLRGLAPQIVIARTAELRPGRRNPGLRSVAEVIAEEMVIAGVDPDAIVILDGRVDSTVDEARVLRRYLEAHPAERVIVATTAYHTGRAGWVIRRELRGLTVEVMMAGAEEFGVGPDNWWRSAGGRRTYVGELAKWFATVFLFLLPWGP